MLASIYTLMLVSARRCSTTVKERPGEQGHGTELHEGLGCVGMNSVNRNLSDAVAGIGRYFLGGDRENG